MANSSVQQWIDGLEPPHPEYRAPGTWMHDALDVRDDWESKLLRTTAWSPLF